MPGASHTRSPQAPLALVDAILQNDGATVSRLLDEDRRRRKGADGWNEALVHSRCGETIIEKGGRRMRCGRGRPIYAGVPLLRVAARAGAERAVLALLRGGARDSGNVHLSGFRLALQRLDVGCIGAFAKARHRYTLAKPLVRGDNDGEYAPIAFLVKQVAGDEARLDAFVQALGALAHNPVGLAVQDAEDVAVALAASQADGGQVHKILAGIESVVPGFEAILRQALATPGHLAEVIREGEGGGDWSAGLQALAVAYGDTADWQWHGTEAEDLARWRGLHQQARLAVARQAATRRRV